jgi:two-component system sensor histidine kinase BaeS
LVIVILLLIGLGGLGAGGLLVIASLLILAAGGLVLARTARRLGRIERERRRFLGDLTHELKTPLSIIRGQAEAIVDGIYPADAAHLAPILDATGTLERLVGELGTLAHGQAGSLELTYEQVDVALLVNETLISFAAAGQAAGIGLHADVAAGLPVLEADPARLRSALGNLITNSLRHTPAGGTVTVSAALAGGEVELSVTDTGEGIDPDLQARIFDRFVKGPGSGGSGIGLAIVRDVVAAHGARLLDVRSGLGQEPGSAFGFRSENQAPPRGSGSGAGRVRESRRAHIRRISSLR